MAKIKRSTAKEIIGVGGELSGSIPILEFTRKGVIRGLKQQVHVKRPNQYPKPVKTS